MAYFGPPPRRRESGRPGRRDVERHVLRRADGDRRARRDEAVLPRPALERGPGRPAPGDGRQAGRLRRRRHLRPRPDGPGRGDGAGGRPSDRRRRTGGPLRRRRGRDPLRSGPGPRRRAGAGAGRTGDRRPSTPWGRRSGSRSGDLAGAAPGPSVAARLRAFMAPSPADREAGVGGLPSGGLAAGPDGLRIGLLEEPSADANGGHLSLAGRALAVRAAAPGGLGLTVFSNQGLRGRSPASGAVLSWGPSGAPVGLASAAAADGIPRRPLAALQQRLRPPGGAADGRRGVAAALGVPAAPRRGRPRPALGSGRPHPGRPGAAPVADGRSRPLGPARSRSRPSGAALSRPAARSASARAGPGSRATRRRRRPTPPCSPAGAAPSDALVRS